MRDVTDYEYKWQGSYSNEKLHALVSKRFIEKIFDILNKGTRYVDVNDKFVGYISAVEGHLGTIHIISDHALTTNKGLFVIIKVTYIDQYVLCLVIDGEDLMVPKFFNGHWANSLMWSEKEWGSCET